ncbi:ABC transporter ATP-binding protein [Blastococcus deserti]
MIEAHELTKRYGEKTAVDGISFTIAPGSVTGFLGPNGAGKSTTMRMVMGPDRPTSGEVTVNGKPYPEHRSPLSEAGPLLDAKAVHPGRSARSHLRTMAATHNIPASRVDEVIEVTGLATVAGKRVGGFSLGMGQRLGIAAAMLGDPRTLTLDESVNGLDPEGVQWVRRLVRSLAEEGRTVFISSHLMSEMAQTADQLLVIGRGRILAAGRCSRSSTRCPAPRCGWARRARPSSPTSSPPTAPSPPPRNPGCSTCTASTPTRSVAHREGGRADRRDRGGRRREHRPGLRGDDARPVRPGAASSAGRRSHVAGVRRHRVLPGRRGAVRPGGWDALRSTAAAITVALTVLLLHRL